MSARCFRYDFLRKVWRHYLEFRNEIKANLKQRIQNTIKTAKNDIQNATMSY